ncbi:HTTM domain-containing protein [Microbacterium album]|uniref:HTTM domain-containing protein n=1 Tax=Microbacterium album TaxID=2053191 RepID=A0A917MN85_9MICO|nr:HTTM domain-containing protein [Microbacterium album]GGH50861.1 HTTM domain-containing protein [Microbacterium album]
MQRAGAVAARAGRFLLLSIRTLLAGGIALVGRILAFCETWLTEAKHARYGIAVMRIILGFTGLGLLLSNFTARSYLYGPASFWNGEHETPKSAFPDIWLFGLGRALAGDLMAFTFYYLLVAALAALLILGWRTRIVLPIFLVLWIGLIELNDASGDQGDNAYRICLFWLMFADSAGRLSLDARRRDRRPSSRSRFVRTWQGERLLPAWLGNTAHNLVLVILTAQVSFIYAAGALYKAGGDPWAEGIAVYAPLQVAKFGTWPFLSDLVTAWAPAVVLASWGSILLQMSFPFMLLHRFTRVIALVGILGFHVSIGVLMGLPWFSLAMVAIDAIFVRDVTWQKMGRAVRDAWRRAGRDADAQAPPPSSDDEAPAHRPAREKKEARALAGAGRR